MSDKGPLTRDAQPTALYRHYSETNELLYVGISSSAPARLAQHMAGSKWARDIARVEIEHLPSREDALATEIAAIKAERPLWNVINNERLARKAATKPKKEKPAYDPYNVPRTIRRAADGLYMLWRFTERVTWRTYKDSNVVGADIVLDRAFCAQSIAPQINERLMTACDTSPSSWFAIGGSISWSVTEARSDSLYLSLLTPDALMENCANPLGSCAAYWAIYDSDVVPAVQAYRREFAAAPRPGQLTLW